MTRDFADSDDSLSEIIEAQIACTSRLVDVLDAERTALIENDIDSLELACRAKDVAAKHLQRLAERMNAKTGKAFTRREIESVLERQDDGLNLLERWRELGRLAALCNDANQANGALLEVREKQVRSALAALQPAAPVVYGRRGSDRPSLPSQIVSRA